MAALSSYEQLLIELINRARLDPAAEAARLGISLNAGLAAGTLAATARQVLAPNELLGDAASAHSLWMLETDTFSHTGIGGSNPGQRMTAAGFAFTGSWTWGENIAWSGTTGTPNMLAYTSQLHDNLFKSPGHRLNILNDNFRELGTGVEAGKFGAYNAVMATQNFAKSGAASFVTGVAINDVDGDNFYDVDEGRSGIDVTVLQGGAPVGSGSTAAAGGYAVAVAGGTVDVVFSGGDLTTSVTVTVEAGTKNAKVDLVDSSEILSSASTALGAGAIDLVLLGVANLNGTGNAAANHLTGNKGANTLAGGDGDDTLTGGAGRDFLFGGAGSDKFDFNSYKETTTSSTTCDVIRDFTRGADHIDLAGIDASTKAAGDQGFSWRGSSAFSGVAGQLRFAKSDVAGTVYDKTIVLGDLNGDKIADFQIEISGLHNLTAVDFIL